MEDSQADTPPEDDTGNRNMHPDHGIENLDHVYGERSDKGEVNIDVAHLVLPSG